MAMLLITCLQSLATNTTTIEELEIERHKKLLKRARKNEGYLHGPDGMMIRLAKQEFPYDIGIWANLVQGMGTVNVRFELIMCARQNAYLCLGVGMVMAILGLSVLRKRPCFRGKWI